MNCFFDGTVELYFSSSLSSMFDTSLCAVTNQLRHIKYDKKFSKILTVTCIKKLKLANNAKI